MNSLPRVLPLVATALLVGLLTLGAGCGADASSSASADAAPASDSAFTKADVENACALLTPAMVRQATGVPDTASLEKIAIPPQTDTPTACSFVWEGADKKARGQIAEISVHSDPEAAAMWFRDQTPTLSKKEMQARLEGATEAAEDEGSISADDAESLQSIADGLSNDASGKSTVYVDVEGIGTRARVELKGAMSTSYGTFVQYKNVTFETVAYYGPTAETAMPDADITELGAAYTAKFKEDTKTPRLEMGKTLAGLVVERLKQIE
jgi:hypothetical protein